MGKKKKLGDTLDQGSSSAIIYFSLLCNVKTLLLSLGLKFTSTELKTEHRESVHSYFLQLFGLIRYPNSSGHLHRTPCTGLTERFLVKHNSLDSSVKFASLLPTNNQQVKMLNRNQFKIGAEVIISFTNMIHSILSEV